MRRAGQAIDVKFRIRKFCVIMILIVGAVAIYMSVTGKIDSISKKISQENILKVVSEKAEEDKDVSLPSGKIN